FCLAACARTTAGKEASPRRCRARGSSSSVGGGRAERGVPSKARPPLCAVARAELLCDFTKASGRRLTKTEARRDNRALAKKKTRWRNPRSLLSKEPEDLRRVVSGAAAPSRRARRVLRSGPGDQRQQSGRARPRL